ncbi:MAG TPA: hypothetical protein VFT34_17470 [Verrucomicrobiae bacterium]|nr:hypothetical protein [Verrucomicrobiae bacterium]
MSRQQRAIHSMLLAGSHVSHIGARLSPPLSTNTVKRRVRSIFAKLGNEARPLWHLRYLPPR